VVGCTNVGKSTFVNRVSRAVQGAMPSNITVSRVHGTTLSNIYVPYKRVPGVHLVDTPGLRAPSTIAARLGVEPTRRVRATTVRLQRGKSVFFGGLARIDYTDGEPRNIYVTLFAAADVSVHVTPTVKADALYARHCGTLLRPPFAPSGGGGDDGGDGGVVNAQSNSVNNCSSTNVNEFDARSEWHVSSDDNTDVIVDNEDDNADHEGTQSDTTSGTTATNDAAVQLVSRRFDLTGERWNDALCDVVLPGIRWAALNALGRFTINAHCTQGSTVYLRDPLMPYEMHDKVEIHKQR